MVLFFVCKSNQVRSNEQHLKARYHIGNKKRKRFEVSEAILHIVSLLMNAHLQLKNGVIRDSFLQYLRCLHLARTLRLPPAMRHRQPAQFRLSVVTLSLPRIIDRRSAMNLFIFYQATSRSHHQQDE